MKLLQVYNYYDGPFKEIEKIIKNVSPDRCNLEIDVGGEKYVIYNMYSNDESYLKKVIRDISSIAESVTELNLR